MTDYAGALVLARQALQAAEQHLALDKHAEARDDLWRVIRACNRIMDWSLDTAPAKV